MAYCKDEANKERFLGIKVGLGAYRGPEGLASAAN
jgi:hypothetical protein